MIIEKIKKTTKEVAKKRYSIEMDEIEIEHPANITFGDYSVNIAFKLSKRLKKKSVKIAEELAQDISKKAIKELEKVESAGGFINFYLSKEFFKGVIEDVLNKKKNWGSNEFFKGKKIIIEYTDPNLFKEFHIGHLMGNVIGESISRIIEFSGAQVKRVNYQGDVGLHIAKAVWGLLNFKLKSDNIKDLGKAYTKGAEAYKKSDKAKKEIDEINKKIYEGGDDKKVNSFYKKGKKTSLKHFEKIYKTLGTKFDRYFFESEVAGVGKKIVEDNIKTGIFEKSDEAVVFRGDLYGLHTRVFINSKSLPTYEAKEIALSELKDSELSPDLSIILSGSEIKEYFKVVKKVMEFINPSISAYTTHISHGIMRLASGKISSKKGNVPSVEDLIEQVYISALEKMEKGSKQVAKQVAIGAIKYSVLKRLIGKDVVFDIEQALSFEGDSGAYLQYTCVRARAVLEKVGRARVEKKDIKKQKEIRDIERHLYRFPEIVEKARENLEPQVVTNYLTELASLFNNFYANEKIIDKEDKDSSYKVALTRATLTTMENGLMLLGIETPKKM